MQRTPEPELMDEDAQARAYSEADFAIPHEAFCDETARVFSSSTKGTILDLGCGPADITVRFARRYPQLRIIGLDGAQAMLDLGRDRIEKAQLTDKIELRRCYLPTTELERSFEGIISNSLLHHLADPNVLWQTISQYATKNAPIFVMDLMRPDSEIKVRELVNTYAADEPDVLRHDFECSLHAAYRANEIEAQLAANGLDHLQVAATSDRHLIVYGYR